MPRLQQIIILLVISTATVFLSGCGSDMHSSSSSSGNSGATGSGSGSSSGSGSGSSSGTPSGNAVPGFGEGTGSSGQTSAAKFLYANPLPGGGPYAAAIQSSGTLTAAQSVLVNNNDPMTMAIDPSGSFLFQTAIGGGAPSGIFAYVINRSNGNLSVAAGSPYLTSTPFYADVVDQQGKFLYAFGSGGVYAFSIQAGTGTLTQISGSPFAASASSNGTFPEPATLLAVDQTNNFLYVSTSTGIFGYTINQSTGQLTAIAGSPFGSGVSDSWAIVITPNNSYLYQLQSKTTTNIYGYSINQTSGALTALSNSPFGAGQCGSAVPSGTIGIPAPDNMTIASAGKFMYDNCGIYSIDDSNGTLTQTSSSGPGDWPVIDPTGNFLWALSSDQQTCFHCDVDVATYQVNPNDGSFTLVPNGFLLLTNSEVGSVNSLAITK
jgi:6-phosphogluconolactonase